MKYFLSILFLCTNLNAADLVSTGLSADALKKELQLGGYIMYVRHGHTNRDSSATSVNDLNDCSTQRNLSELGKQQMTQMGKKIVALGIKVSSVVSSPYCRAKDTAQLAFGDFTVDPDLAFSISKKRSEVQRLGKHLHQIMMEAMPKTKNIVFVGHTSNLKEGLGVWPKPEGVVAVFKKEDGKMIYKGAIKPEEWL